jgi:hypothetical protein
MDSVDKPPDDPQANDEQPRRPDELTRENVEAWASTWISGVERGIQLGETEVGHSLPWARDVAKGTEPRPDP